MAHRVNNGREKWAISHVVVLVPAKADINLADIDLNIVHTVRHGNIHLDIFGPVTRPHANNSTPSRAAAVIHTGSSAAATTRPLGVDCIRNLLSDGRGSILVRRVITGCRTGAGSTRIILIRNLIPAHGRRFTRSLGCRVTGALGTRVIFIVSRNASAPRRLGRHVRLAHGDFNNTGGAGVANIVIGGLGTPISRRNHAHPSLSRVFSSSSGTGMGGISPTGLRRSDPLPILNTIP